MSFETGWLQGPFKKVMQPLAHRLWDLQIEGLENVPAEGPALITPNHVAFIDSVFVSTIMPRRTLAVGKADYMDSWKTRYILPATGMIPIDRAGGSASQAALDAAAESLNRGDLFLIYPEGTRTRTGYLHKGRTGAARLALRTGAPIIPVGVRGTDKIQPIDSVKPVTGVPCEIRIGKPIDVSRYRDRPSPAPDHRRGHVRGRRTLGPDLRRRLCHRSASRLDSAHGSVGRTAQLTWA